MHHEDAGFNCGGFTGLEYHRTDGQFGRSAALQYFNIGLFRESQVAIARICDLECELAVLSKFHIPVVDLILVHFDGRCATTTSTPREKNCRDEKQTSAQRRIIALRAPLKSMVPP
jgi:hypothetical protein